jgi:hypothetical protein
MEKYTLQEYRALKQDFDFRYDAFKNLKFPD